MSPVAFKGHGMCYPVCVMVHIKDPLLLEKSSTWQLSNSTIDAGMVLLNSKPIEDV